MAATYESQSEAQSIERPTRPNPLPGWERPLAAVMQWDWDVILLVALMVVGFVTRFWDLSVRAYNHDESIHTNYAFGFYQGKGYIHNPTYHGPLLYHLTALTFFLLGDNDSTGRVPNVLMGLVILAMPFFFRQWLGRRGWFVTALLLLVSPAVTYYSRFNRHDVYVEVFVLLMLLAIVKYIDTRANRWLYTAVAALALAFTAMETTFIFLALFGYGLVTLFTWNYLKARTDVTWPERAQGLAAVFLGLPFFAGYMVYYLARLLLNRGEFAEDEIDPRRFPEFDLAVILGSISLPLTLTPVLLKLAKIDPAGFPANANIQAALPYLLALIAVIAISAVIGIIWDMRRWTVSALIFYPIMLFFFTAVFTNFAGVGTGFIGSLGYWLSQQDVARGAQPWYYYIAVLLPLYEYVPFGLGLLGMLWALTRTSGARMLIPVVWLVGAFGFWLVASPILDPTDAARPSGWFTTLTLVLAACTVPLVAWGAYNPDRPRTHFQMFIFVWALGNLILFSWAGEKMPWLTMHLVIPLAFITGHFMDGVLQADWWSLVRKGAGLFGLLLTIGLLILGLQIFFGPAPIQGMSLDQANQTATLLFSVVVVGVIAGYLYLLATRLGAFDTVRVTLVTLFLIGVAFTIHHMLLAAYINSDIAVEHIIYAQGSPDDPQVMREIDDLSRRLCAQNPTDGKKVYNCDNGTIKVAYDDESTWPLEWYLRNYRNRQYYGKTPGAPFDAEVVIVGAANEAGIKAFLGSRYYRRQYRLIWWPLETYKDLNWDRIVEYLKPEQFKSLVRDIWFFHKYNESLSAWPYVHTFAMYVRKDIATTVWNYSSLVNPSGGTATDDEYSKKYLPDVRAVSVVGAAGIAPGQLNNPRSITFDAQGNLYVTDAGNFRIEKFDPSGKFLAQFGSGQGAGPGQFGDGPGGGPWGIAVDKAGNVYAADTWNHRIVKFDPAGKVLTQWGVFGQAPSAGEALNLLYGPRDIAIDADGNLWVSDTGNKRIVKFDPNGRALIGYGGAGGDPGQFLEPVGLAFDRLGNLYVADTWNQRIQKFDGSMTPLMQIALQGWDSQSVLNKPYLAVDPDGNVYATDPDNFRVLKFGPDGKLFANFGARGADAGSFETPTGIGLGPNGRLYVVDSGNSRVLVFESIK